MPKVQDYYSEQPKDYEIREATRSSIMNQAKNLARESYNTEIKGFATDVYNFLKGDKDK